MSATTPASTANRALDAISNRHVELIDELQKKLDKALPNGKQMTDGLHDEITAILGDARRKWEAEMSSAYASVRDNPEPPAVVVEKVEPRKPVFNPPQPEPRVAHQPRR